MILIYVYNHTSKSIFLSKIFDIIVVSHKNIFILSSTFSSVITNTFVFVHKNIRRGSWRSLVLTTRKERFFDSFRSLSQWYITRPTACFILWQMAEGKGTAGEGGGDTNSTAVSLAMLCFRGVTRVFSDLFWMKKRTRNHLVNKEQNVK